MNDENKVADTLSVDSSWRWSVKHFDQPLLSESSGFEFKIMSETTDPKQVEEVEVKRMLTGQDPVQASIQLLEEIEQLLLHWSDNVWSIRLEMLPPSTNTVRGGVKIAVEMRRQAFYEKDQAFLQAFLATPTPNALTIPVHGMDEQGRAQEEVKKSLPSWSVPLLTESAKSFLFHVPKMQHYYHVHKVIVLKKGVRVEDVFPNWQPEIAALWESRKIDLSLTPLGAGSNEENGDEGRMMTVKASKLRI